MNTIGETIKRLRLDRGMAQHELSSAIKNLSSVSIGRIERGRQPAHLPVQKAIAQAMGLSMQQWEAEIEKTRKMLNPLELYPELKAQLLLEAEVFGSQTKVINAAVWLFGQSAERDKITAITAAARIASGAASLSGIIQQNEVPDRPVASRRKKK